MSTGAVAWMSHEAQSLNERKSKRVGVGIKRGVIPDELRLVLTIGPSDFE